MRTHARFLLALVLLASGAPAAPTEFVVSAPPWGALEAVVPASVTAPSVATYGVAAWHAAGLTGAGVKVGVIDGGFRGIVALMGSELPATVHARCRTGNGTHTDAISACDTGSVHGTAAAELIVDMAPAVELYVATWSSPADAVETVNWMVANGVRIISASFTSGWLFDGPGDGTSGRASSFYDAVNAAAAGGILWVNSAGNAGDESWTGAWSDDDVDGLLDFADGDEENTLTLAAGQPLRVAMRWADPWGASSNDHDLYLVQGADVIASSTDRQAGAGDPYESLSVTAPRAGAYGIRVVSHGAAPNRRIDLMVVSDGRPIALQFHVAGGSLPSPADSASTSMITVGAVAAGPSFASQPYSSTGPTLDGRAKPELLAVDCLPTVSYRAAFCGTSASAPTVAGGAALALQANPALSAAALAADLRSRALPIGATSTTDPLGQRVFRLGATPTSTVAPRQVVSLRSSVASASVGRGTTVRFSATVGPTRVGQPPATVAFVVYRRVGTAWIHYRTAAVVASPAGLAVLKWTFGSRGSWYVRAQALRTTSSGASPWSELVRFVVQ